MSKNEVRSKITKDYYGQDYLFNIL